MPEIMWYGVSSWEGNFRGSLYDNKSEQESASDKRLIDVMEMSYSR